MHVLIISPLREGYMNLCGWLDGLKSERVTILTQTKYENNMNKMLKLNNQDEFCQVKSIEAFILKSSPNLCVKYFFPGTSCAGDANASMSAHYHS